MKAEPQVYGMLHDAYGLTVWSDEIEDMAAWHKEQEELRKQGVKPIDVDALWDAFFESEASGESVEDFEKRVNSILGI